MSLDLARRVRMALFDLDPSEARLEARGFAVGSADKREALEGAASRFIVGYRAAIRTGDPRETAAACNEVPLPRRGFAYEGGAMGLAVLDLVTTGTPRRFNAYLDLYGDRHAYMLHVGAGWAIARCPWGAVTFLPKLEPILAGLTVDGIGFHCGFFSHAALYERQKLPLLRRTAPDAFDAGLGRALWFVSGAQPANALRRVDAFAPERRPSLWSGLGLAVSYAGAASDAELQELAVAAGERRPYLALGAAFAAKARARAGNDAEHTDRACRAFCNLPAAEAAAMTDRCFERFDSTGPGAYDRWRQTLVETFASQLAPAVAIPRY